MTKHRIGLIGGSGLYHIEGFTRQKWVKMKTPFGPPSDAFLTGALAGREVVFLPRHGRGHRILPSELNHRANIYGHEKTRGGLDHQRQRRRVPPEKIPALRHRPARPVSWTAPSAHLSTPFSGAALSAHIAFADPVCAELRQLALGRTDAATAPKAPRPQRRRLREHGRSGLQHPGRIPDQPPARLRRHRHDQPGRGQMRARGRDRLRHHGHDHRLRLLESRTKPTSRSK